MGLLKLVSASKFFAVFNTALMALRVFINFNKTRSAISAVLNTAKNFDAETNFRFGPDPTYPENLLMGFDRVEFNTENPAPSCKMVA
ncbi:hypothetical protein OUZ56_012899 [Daphnia magna]|uniref:Uncharacterized protein n=1 Tax=Daphnia magna TaxID=35525 RepID=A0ABQ9Z4C8_9CRUS|nr:hypothetical protein OUZ56_012899 [Daphnia magna]